MKIERRPNQSARKPKRAGEQSGEGRGHEGTDPVEAEKRRRRRAQEPAAGEAWRDIAGEEEIGDFKAAAERQQDHEPAEIGRRRRAFEPARNLARSRGCARKIGFSLKADCRHPVLPGSSLDPLLPARFFGGALSRRRHVGGHEPEIQKNISIAAFEKIDSSNQECRLPGALPDLLGDQGQHQGAHFLHDKGHRAVAQPAEIERSRQFWLDHLARSACPAEAAP